MKHSHLTVKLSLMNARWAITAVQVEAHIKLVQDHSAQGILVISILSLEMSVDLGNKIPYVNKDAVPVTIFILFFKVIQLLEAETNKYNNQYT
jgi:hypothetical protein